MARELANSPQLLRRINSGSLIRFALRADEFTAAEAMAATGLTRATVLGICDDLVDGGWLEESSDSLAAGLSRKGRPARRYTLRADAGVVVGLDAGEHWYTVRVSDLRGRPLRTRRRAVASHAIGREGRVRAARELIDAVLDDAGRGAGDVMLTLIGIPAPVDAAGASPVGDGSLWPLMNAGFPEGLAGTVIVENDANLAALAEQAASGGDRLRNTATLLMGERLGAGIIVDGRLLRGARGGAGEMRFLDVIFSDPDAVATAGAGALARIWAREAMRASDVPSALRRLDGDDIQAEDVFHAAGEGDELASEIMARLASRLVRVSLVLCSVVDVERIIFAGQIAAAIEPVLALARAELAADFYPPVPELVASALGSEAVVTGAVESALARIRGNPLDFEPRG